MSNLELDSAHSEHTDEQGMAEITEDARLLTQTLRHLQAEIRDPDHYAFGVTHRGERYRSFPSAQALLTRIWNMTGGFRIPKSRMPTLIIPVDGSARDMNSDGSPKQYIAGHESRLNFVTIPQDAWLGRSKDSYQLGDKVGAEFLGHCYRQYHLYRYGAVPEGPFPYGGKLERGDTEEFFDGIGRQLMRALLRKRGALHVLFPKDEEALTKTESALKERMRSTHNQVTSELAFDKTAGKDGHEIGYRWARALDISRLSEDGLRWLYSLPSDEVATRFFRPDPDWSGMQQA